MISVFEGDIMKLKITALDNKGNVYFDEETKTQHSLSEMEYFINQLKLKLLEGEVTNIIIERI